MNYCGEQMALGMHLAWLGPLDTEASLHAVSAESFDGEPKGSLRQGRIA